MLKWEFSTWIDEVILLSTMWIIRSSAGFGVGVWGGNGVGGGVADGVGSGDCDGVCVGGGVRVSTGVGNGYVEEKWIFPETEPFWCNKWIFYKKLLIILF